MSQQGTVKSFNPLKGFGFITTPEGNDVFLHIRGCNTTDTGGMPVQSDKVTYDLVESQIKPGQMQAANVSGGTGVPPNRSGGAYRGICKSFNAEKGFGFIKAADGTDLYFHVTLMIDGSTPWAGDRLAFDIEESKIKPGQVQAHNISGGTGWAEGGKDASWQRCAGWGEEGKGGGKGGSHPSHTKDGMCFDSFFQAGTNLELDSALKQAKEDQTSLQHAVKLLQFELIREQAANTVLQSQVEGLTRELKDKEGVYTSTIRQMKALLESEDHHMNRGCPSALRHPLSEDPHALRQELLAAPPGLAETADVQQATPFMVLAGSSRSTEHKYSSYSKVCLPSEMDVWDVDDECLAKMEERENRMAGADAKNNETFGAEDGKDACTEAAGTHSILSHLFLPDKELRRLLGAEHSRSPESCKVGGANLAGLKDGKVILQ